MQEPEGSLHRRHIGEGRIAFIDGATAKCDFVLEQDYDGDIRVNCLLKPGQENAWRNRPAPSDFWNQHNNYTLEGQIGEDLWVQKFKAYALSQLSENEWVFHITQAEFSSDAVINHPLSYIRFYLVNYEITAVPESTITLPGNSISTGVHLSLRIENKQIWLKAVPDATKIVKELERSGGIHVTAELIVPCSSLNDLASAVSINNNLCTILTLLSGNRVNWLSYEVISTDNQVVQIHAQDAVTRSYTTESLINTLNNAEVALHGNGTAYIPIIERMMEHFSQALEQWNIRRAVNSWHEALGSQHFPEQRGQLIATCMEMLRTSYLRHGGQEFILPSELFESKRNRLSKQVKSFLRKNFL